MEKKPEVDGKWLEIDASECIANKEGIESSEILVVTSARIEMGSSDKERFSEKFCEFADRYEAETAGMDDEQKSFFILRKMLID